jgi:hypothetical protein
MQHPMSIPYWRTVVPAVPAFPDPAVGAQQ